MKAVREIRKALFTIGLLTPLSMAMAQATPPAGSVPTPGEFTHHDGGV